MIKTENLTKQFQNETAISYRDLCFEDGRSYCLLGASGCGKSTLLNMLAGVITPTTGSILIDGTAMNALSQRRRDAFRIRSIGYVFQDFKLIEEMTVEDNLDLLRLEHIDTSGMNDVLDSLGILPLKKRRAKSLSGGEKQRVAIARALVKKPAIILADEPTGNLNFEIGSIIVRELLQAARGQTLIVVTHDDRLQSSFDFVLDMNEITAGGVRHA